MIILNADSIGDYRVSDAVGFAQYQPVSVTELTSVI